MNIENMSINELQEHIRLKMKKERLANANKVLHNVEFHALESQDSGEVYGATVYALLNSEGEVQYVGTTANMAKRLEQHRLNAKVYGVKDMCFGVIKRFQCFQNYPTMKMEREERHYIELLKPIGNTVHNKPLSITISID